MKKFFFALLIAITPILFSACSEDPATPATEKNQTSLEKLDGVVQKLGISIYQQGTHRLEKDGALVALLEAAGHQIKFDDFIGKEVEVEGIISPTAEGNLEIIKVVAITLSDGVVEKKSAAYKKYDDSQFNFSLKYSSVLTAQQTRRGTAFVDSESSESEPEKIIEVIVLENAAEQNLSDWLVDNYGYSADALRRVVVAGLVGYQFQNATGSVIYLGNEDKVFTLAWYDNSEVDRARNREFYLELVKSFTVVGVNSSVIEPFLNSPNSNIAKIKELCGGVAAIQCGEGLECRLSGNYPDVSGICVRIETVEAASGITSDQVKVNEELPKISAVELQRGWYYGDRDQKKLNTPFTWIQVNSGSRSAMWRRTEDSAADPEIELPNATATPSQLSLEQRKVLDFLTEKINFLAPEKSNFAEWTLSQLSFVDPNFVYVVYDAGNSIAGTQTRRSLFLYAVTDDEVSTEMQAYFKPGVEKDWLVVEGSDAAFGKAQKIVNTSGEIISDIAGGYRLFFDRSNGFEFQYPKNWYWRKPVAGRIEFADKPFPAGVPILVVKIVAGTNYEFDSLLEERDEQVTYVVLDAKKSLRISVPVGYDEALSAAVRTFKLRK